MGVGTRWPGCWLALRPISRRWAGWFVFGSALSGALVVFCMPQGIEGYYRSALVSPLVGPGIGYLCLEEGVAYSVQVRPYLRQRECIGRYRQVGDGRYLLETPGPTEPIYLTPGRWGLKLDCPAIPWDPSLHVFEWRELSPFRLRELRRIGKYGPS